MKIGLDIRVLMDKYYSGVSEYTANLLAAILKINNSENNISGLGQAENLKNDYRLFYNSFHNLDERLSIWNTKTSTVVGLHLPNKIFNYLLQRVFSYPKIDSVLGGVDLFWSPHFNFTSLSRSTKKIITVHDLSFLRYREFFSWRKNFWHRALSVKKILHSADKIIAVSDSTKNDLVELIGLDPNKISVIYSGNNLSKREVTVEEARDFFTKNDLIADKSDSSLKPEYLLYLGTIEPRKNISGLIKAYEDLRRNNPGLTNLKLFLAGGKGWKSRQIYQTWAQSKYKSDIKFLSYVSKKDKEILYSQAKVFIYPSYYEGFGFPPLEAMIYGIPVVCSNVSSLPEVVGEAALMINPFKPGEMTEAIKLILEDEKLRLELIEKGYKQAAEFSWNKAAKNYLRIFQELK